MSKRKKTGKQSSHKRFEPLYAKLPKDVRAFYEPKGEVKMSEVLLDFLDPLMDGGESEQELHKLIKFGMMAWNAALLPSDELKKSLSTGLKGLPLETRLTLKSLFDMLLRRKQEFFVDNRRMIMEYNLTMNKNGPHLSVASSLTSSES